MILSLPYFRFCQIIETINKRLVGKLKFELKTKELVTKFLGSMFIAGSFLNKEGKISLMKQIDEFFLLKEEETVCKKEEGLPGSFEKLMKFFGGRR